MNYPLRVRWRLITRYIRLWYYSSDLYTNYHIAWAARGDLAESTYRIIYSLSRACTYTYSTRHYSTYFNDHLFNTAYLLYPTCLEPAAAPASAAQHTYAREEKFAELHELVGRLITIRVCNTFTNSAVYTYVYGILLPQRQRDDRKYVRKKNLLEHRRRRRLRWNSAPDYTIRPSIREKLSRYKARLRVVLWQK